MNPKSKHIPNNTDASQDYFGDLQKSIMAKVEGDSYHLPLGITHPFIAPEGYLASLQSSNFVNPNYIPLHLSAPFNTPEGYIENFESKLNSFKLPLGISHAYMAPNGYLKNFETEMVVKAKTDSFGLPLTISQPFTAPEGYFETLETSLLRKTKTEQSGKVSPFTQIWRNYGRAFRVAATVILISSFGFGLYQNYNKTVTTNDELTLAELNTDDIISYLEAENLDLTDFSMVLEEDDAIFSNSFVDDTNTESMEELTDEELLELMDFQFDYDI